MWFTGLRGDVSWCRLGGSWDFGSGLSVVLEMDSHEEHVEFDSAGCQQTRLSGYFRNVHSKFSPHAKKGAKVEDVVIASQVVRKKPLLVIGDFSDSVAQPEAWCGDRSEPLDGLPTPQLPASVRCNENVVDSTKGLATGPERDSVLSNPSSDTFADYSNAKKPNAGAGTKRKATKSEVCTHRAGLTLSYFKHMFLTITVPLFLALISMKIQSIDSSSVFINYVVYS